MRPGLFAGALALDAIVGDPAWLPHPVRAMGAAIACCDAYARDCGLRERPRAGRLAGVLTTAGIVTGTYALAAWSVRGGVRRSWLVELVAAASTLAWRSLLGEADAVARALEEGDLARARGQLARIVGRDTQELDEPEICRATIETLAESLCDGIVAPLLYLAVGGAPLALAYKATNTLDSMVGHLEPPYRYFGWCAARLDDAANLVPARLSAIAIATAAQLFYGTGRSSVRTCLRDAWRHRSPNAGWPEAAMAGALGVRLGGLNAYDGAETRTATLGAEFAAPRLGDVRRAMRIVTGASALVGLAALAVLAVMQRNPRTQ